MTTFTGDTNDNTFVDSTGADVFDGGAGIDRISAESGRVGNAFLPTIYG